MPHLPDRTPCPDLAQSLTPQAISSAVLREKYLQDGETSVQALYDRVARALASVEKPELRDEFEARFRRNLDAGAIGAGRIMSAAGTGNRSTLINCFVLPVGDCIEGVDDEGYPGLCEALHEAAETLRRGGGVGYDFSRIRPRGARIEGTACTAPGPCRYINELDQSCATLESAGARRGAQMGVLRCDHPDVLEFITAKRTPGRWKHFTVSVGATDAFIEAVQQGRDWQLVHPAQPGAEQIPQGARQRKDGQWVYRTLPAQALWDTIMQSAYDFAEPGILFLDRIQTDNNLRAIESIRATNPCGEQPLPPYGCCDLGPIILPRFVRHAFGHGGQACFDFDAFADSVALQVRALDNVLDLTDWPLPQQQRQAQAKRRIGVGFTGLGDALVMLGLAYNAPEGREMARRIAECMRDTAYRASVALAVEKGAFPLFDAKSFLAHGTFASRLPEAIQQQIRSHGLRNSHLLSIAPTGSVSLAFADNTSSGIEPAFAWTCTRTMRKADGTRSDYEVQDHAFRLYKALGGDTAQLPPAFVGALEMSAQDHIAMVQAVQPCIDASISKTVNVVADCPYEDFKQLYMQAWAARLKGLATYRPNHILGAVLAVIPAEPAAPPAQVPALAPVMERKCPVIDSPPMQGLDGLAEKIGGCTHQGHK